MSVLKIEDDDILWKFYRKAYEVDDCHVEHPGNLCRYFWTAVWGMVLSFYVDLSLWLVWGVSLLAVTGLWGICSVGRESSSIALRVTLLPIVFLMMFLVMGIFAATGKRLKGRSQTVFCWILAGGFLAFVGGSVTWWFIVVGYYIAEEGFWPALKWTGFIVAILVIVVGFLAAMFGIVSAIGHFTFHPMGSWKVIQTICVYMKAAKRQICPLIEPPESFMAAYEFRKVNPKE